jgi:hypothetical protein
MDIPIAHVENAKIEKTANAIAMSKEKTTVLNGIHGLEESGKRL